MVNRVLNAKFVKLKAQRRRYPRRMDLDKRGPLANFTLIRQASEGAKGIAHEDWYVRLDNGEVLLESQVPIVNQHLSAKAEIDLTRIDHKWDVPKYFGHIDNHVHRIRVYYNSRKTKYIVQQLHRHQKIFRLSMPYSSLDDVRFALQHNIVSWAIEKPFPA